MKCGKEREIFRRMADESNGHHVVGVRRVSSDIKGRGWFSVRARLDFLPQF